MKTFRPKFTTYLLRCITVAFGFNAINVLPAKADALLDSKAQLAQAAVVLNGLHNWDAEALNAQQLQAKKQLNDTANLLIHRPDYSIIFPGLLNDYKNQDGYARQALIHALLRKSDYAVSDLLFLKQVFLASTSFHYDEHRTRVRDWYEKFDVQYKLSNIILGVSGRSDLIGKADTELLSTNPEAWLAKYSP